MKKAPGFAAAAALTLTLVLAACSPEAAETAVAAAPSPTAAPSTVQYPLTVDGRFGTSTVAAQPKRVLPLSPQGADIALSLGVVPIALPTDAQNQAATNGLGKFAWQEAALGDATPDQLLLESLQGVAEKIAALEPDVILATGFWGLDQGIFDQLNAQVPVVHFDVRANGEPWQNSTRTIGRVLGIPERADEVIAATEHHLSRTAAAHPELAGRGYNVLIGDMGGGQQAILASDERGIGQFISSLGLRLSDVARTVPTDPDGRGLLSTEQLARLDTDVLFVVTRTDDLGEYERLAPWSALEPVRRGAVVQFARTSGLPNALGFPSPISLDWAADQVVPEIVAAVGR